MKYPWFFGFLDYELWFSHVVAGMTKPRLILYRATSPVTYPDQFEFLLNWKQYLSIDMPFKFSSPLLCLLDLSKLSWLKGWKPKRHDSFVEWARSATWCNISWQFNKKFFVLLIGNPVLWYAWTSIFWRLSDLLASTEKIGKFTEEYLLKLKTLYTL